MKLKILHPLWGHEQMPIEAFLDMTRAAGYDGIETWIPTGAADTTKMLHYLRKHDMTLVLHQHEAHGDTFESFQRSFLQNLKVCASLDPVLINSHTGRDWFSVEENLALIQTACEFSNEYNIMVTHETHRGRTGSAPFIMQEYFKRKQFYLTADFSHWTCVTESMLENFGEIVSESIIRTRHIHARIGYEQGPQVPDPRAPQWQYAVSKFLAWWDQIVDSNFQQGNLLLTITTEFGPPPYMPVEPFTVKAVADQFEINCYMKDLLRKRYAAFLQD